LASKTVRTAPLTLGLTGGIGSGKSTVAQLLVARGAALIDADAISRAATAPGGAAIPLIAAQFGAAFVDADGGMRRDLMRQHVFDNPDARARLEAIVHPVVGQQIAAQLQAHTLAGAACIVFDIPLLVESGHWRRRLQRVLVVDCSAATQISRVMARSGLAADQVQAIITTQASRAQRLAAADAVLCNDGLALPALAALVQQMASQFGL
jgi:dephospho-CoA kinase